MLNLLRNWKYLVILGLGVVVAILTWQNKSLQENVETKQEKVVELRSANESLSTTLTSLQENQQNQAVRLENMMGASRVLQEENNRLQRELGGYKSREEIVIKKPKLIERRANDAVDKLMCDYARATSEDTDCGEDNN